MVARRVSCFTLPLLRLLSLGLLTFSLFVGVSSRALFVSAHSTSRILALPPTHACSFGARLQPQSTAFRSSTQASRGTPTFGSPFSGSVAHDRLVHLLPVVQEILQSHSLVFRNPPNLPTQRCGAALDIILSPGYVTGQLWLPLVTAVSLSGTSLSWSTTYTHSPTSLHVLPLWTLSSAPSPKSSSTVHPFALVVAPPCLVHARGNLSGGIVRATTPLLLAGVTSTALGHMRIRLVSASCASSS